MPLKIRRLISDLECAGFAPIEGGKGSHRKFRHPRFLETVILSGKAGDDACHIEKAVLFIRRFLKGEMPPDLENFVSSEHLS